MTNTCRNKNRNKNNEETNKQTKNRGQKNRSNKPGEEGNQKKGRKRGQKEGSQGFFTLRLLLSCDCHFIADIQILCKYLSVSRSTHELQVNVGRVSSATQPPLTVSTCLHVATEDYSSIKKKGLFRVNFQTFDCNEPKRVTKAGRAERSRHRPTAK